MHLPLGAWWAFGLVGGCQKNKKLLIEHKKSPQQFADFYILTEIIREQ
jgi:hypothetical protein